MQKKKNQEQNIIKQKCSKLKNVLFFGFLKIGKKKKIVNLKNEIDNSPNSLGQYLKEYKLKTRKSLGHSFITRAWLLRLLDFFVGLFRFIFKTIKWSSLRGVVVILLFVFVIGSNPQVLSAPQSKTISSKSEWEEGDFNNTKTTLSSGKIQLKSDGSWTARTWSPSPDNISFGSTSVLVGDYLYVVRGYGDKALFRYDINENKWDTIQDLPQAAHYGCDATYDGSEGIYFTFGGYSKDFYYYNIENDSWTKLPDLLDTIYQGSSITSDGTNVYITRGQNSTDFWRYDISEGSWYNLSPSPATLYRGSNMVYGQNGYLYINRGYNRNTFYRYDIANNIWDTMTNAPITFYGEQKGVYYNGYVYFLRSNNNTGFVRYNISTNTWDTLEDAPATTNYSSLTYNSDDGYIYAIRGNGQYQLWKFDPSAGTSGKWIGPKNTPGGINTGGDLIWNEVEGVGAYVYAIRGGSNLYRFDINTNDWSTMTNSPATLSYGTKGTYYNGYIYIPRGGNTATFYSYNTATDTWSSLADAPANLNHGSSAAYNSGDGYIYISRGAASNDFYRYDIAGNSWTQMTDIKADDADYRVYVGGQMESDGTNLYLMPGDGETAFLKYNTSSNSWSKLSATPFAQYYGTDMTYHNGKIYAIAGYYKDELWEYDISGNLWRQLPSNQKYTYGRGPYNGASLEYAGDNSFYATPGMGLTDMWSYSLSASSYLLSGTYTSNTIDLSYVNSWISVTATDDTPSNTSITYETRTSSDGETWSTWQALSGTDIQSPTNRYIQVKITLSSTDGASTPTVDDFTISYNSEEVEPVNPSSVKAYSQQINGDTLTSETAYNHAHPYFSWTGATDNGSGVDGYWVYFGTDNNADPAISGVFQEDTTYSVNLAMNTGNYYLLIKTQDNDGNISSSSWNAFIYNYNGVSPFLTEDKSSQSDFDLGSFDKMTTLGEGSMRLNSVNGFWNESRMSYAPGGIRYGGELAYANSEEKLYTFRGNNTLSFYSYDLSTNVWNILADAPATVRMGGTVINGPDGYLYASRGNNTPEFWRYDIVNDVWEVMASAPKNFYYGGSLSYDGSRYVYALPGNDDAFYRYDTQNNIWTTLSNAEFGNPNEVDGQRVYVGSDSVYDERNNVYVLQGNYYPYFGKYSIGDDQENGETADTWTVLAPAPAGIYAGGSLTYSADTNAIYMLSGNWRQNFFKYDIASDTWTQLPQIPFYVEYGASLKAVNGYIYATRGAGSTGFYRFNIEESSWEVPQRGFFGPSNNSGSSYFGFYYGTEIANDNSDNIYIVRGYRDNTFGRYNIKSGEFTELARTPVGVYNGAAMIFNEDENAFYLTSGDIRTRVTGANNYFMKYSVSTDTWETITTDPVPIQTSYGSSMTYDGERYIYLTRGSNSNSWWRYDTQASAGSRWSSILPTISGWTQGYGGRIILRGNYIYSIRGQNTNTFWRYDISAGSWMQLANTPGNVYIGGSLTDGEDGYLYVTSGYNRDDYYRYNIANDTWEEISNVPGQVYQGGASVYYQNRIWTTAGTGANSYRDGLYSYVIGSESVGSGFEKNGEYISESTDLLSVYRWANLTINYEKPNNTSVAIYTRTSDNDSTWSSWDRVSNEKSLGSNQYRYNIVSPASEYIQIKAELTSGDQIFSPKINNYQINYYQDIQAPSNPTTVSAFDSSLKENSVADGSWYNNASPYFEWPVAEGAGGASDGSGGSGVVGYWVYFGTNVDADPFVDGTYQATTNYTANSLISGEIYYLKIKAVDDAGMIPASAFSAFTYKFDSTSPTNPSDISVTPAGFTASDDYDFVWESDVSDVGSGVSKFQYRTGGDDTDVWYDIADISTVAISLPNNDHIVGAYQSGKNWLYLRVVDNAGNVSEPMAQEYYYSADAPSPPENLTVDPAYSTGNLFSFEWEQPSSFIGDTDKLKYFYSVNTLPNAYNTTETSLKAAGPGPFATQKGSNRFYVVAMDEAGNINYDLYAYADFTADTTAPGAPINVQIFDTSDRENQEYSVAIKWSPPTSVDEDNFSGYVIYRSLEENGTYKEIATTSGTAYVDTGLESIQYFYYVKSKDNTNNLSVASSTTNIIPTGRYTTPPKLTQEPKVTIKSFIASFNWGTNRVASSFVEYGKTISLSKTNGQVDSVTDHTVNISGLSASTKYFYRVKYIDPDGNIGTSDIGNFTTLDPPVVSDFTVGDISLDTAYISWTTNTAATCTLKYGAGSYASSIEEIGSATKHVQKLVGLIAETTYQVQTSCIDSDLNEFSSDQYNFSTPVKPVAKDVKVENKENVDIPTVTIEYTTNVPTTTHIFFKHNDEGSPHTFLNEKKVTEHKAEIEGLDPAKEYMLTISGTDENGIEVDSIEQKITTKSDSRPPEILVNRAVGKVLGRGNDAQANIYVKIETNETTKVKIKYTQGVTVSNFEQSTGEDPLNTYHLITIPAKIGQIYSYQAEVYDEAGNLTTTKAATVVVENARSSAFEIVAGTATKRFGWLSNLWGR